ncbi:sorbosone dehydrogenase family protein [Xylophilus rhododendri]|uniref:Sorbosone dehydrogenase family protein n=2 Tax=Xylophilus rhododendri TaxID=2697032 RepID=A0A857JFB7_9BURK|nr:sorbosone dehydrogenase family protein [Xylophilus rhododendri]
MRLTGLAAASLACLLAACGEHALLPESAGIGPSPTLPAPTKPLIPTLHIAPAKGWRDGAMPQPVAGTVLTKFAEGLEHPRWVYVLPNGDVLVAESDAPAKDEKEKHNGPKAWVQGLVMKRAGSHVPSADRITLLRDADGDGVAETRNTYVANLKSPYGMVLVGNELFIANADALVKLPYQAGATSLPGTPTKVIDLPGGINHHWTKNVIASEDGSKLYVSVGSNSNVGENGLDKEEGRAAIWEVDRASGQHRIFASGLRNPNGMGWEPTTKALWTVVNERDELGSDLVPDYLTSVKDGGFYGWPFSYWGQNVDERPQPPNPALVAKAIKPDYGLGNHVAPLGMAFATGNQLPPQFASGVFVGEHGSWNRKPRAGYKVVFIPFVDGMPKGQPIDVLTGFVDSEGNASGRPVGVAIDRKGGLLVADDVGNTVWRVSGMVR